MLPSRTFFAVLLVALVPAAALADDPEGIAGEAGLQGLPPVDVDPVQIGVILDHCRTVQDETGWTDPERILDRVLNRN